MRKTIVAGLLVTLVLFSLSLADKNFLYPALIAAMILMHLGMHGMHGKHKEG